MKGTCLLVVAIGLLAQSPYALADETAAAEATFQRGKKAMSEGRFREACEDFALSEKLESSVGTLLNLGECNTKLGKLATAWASFEKAVVRAGQDGQTSRMQYAKKRAAELKPRLTYLLVEAPSSTPGLQISRTSDGATVIVGVPLPVDPGTFVFEAKASGFESWTKTVIAEGEGKTIKVSVPDLVADKQPTQSETEELDTPVSDSGKFSIGLSAGVGKLFAQDVKSTVGPAFAFAANWRPSGTKPQLDFGATTLYSNHPWTKGSASGTTQAISLLATVGVSGPISEALSWTVQTGAGIVLLLGLDDGMNPLVAPGVVATGTILLGQVQASIGIDYALNDTIALQLSPIVLTYSPTRQGINPDIASLNSFKSLFGVAVGF